MYQSKKTRGLPGKEDVSDNSLSRAFENVVHSQFGDPPPNWYPGPKFCPFHGGECKNFHCMAWNEESPDTGGFCVMIGRFAVNE